MTIVSSTGATVGERRIAPVHDVPKGAIVLAAVAA
jgi:hypothetical protein